MTDVNTRVKEALSAVAAALNAFQADAANAVGVREQTFSDDEQRMVRANLGAASAADLAALSATVQNLMAAVNAPAPAAPEMVVEDFAGHFIDQLADPALKTIAASALVPADPAPQT